MQIPPAFIVTLKRTPERLAETLAHICERGLPSPHVFYGVDGRNLNVGSFHLNDEMGCHLRSPVVGCLLSHRLLWTLLLRLPYNEFLIFEDDVILPSDFISKFKEYSEELPGDWDMLYVGGHHYPGQSGKVIQYTPHLHRYNPMGLYAYVVKRSFLTYLLAATSQELADADVIIGRKLASKNLYIFDPPLVNCRPWASQTKEAGD